MTVTNKRTDEFKTVWTHFTTRHTLVRLKLHTRECHFNNRLKENDLQFTIFCDDLLVTQCFVSDDILMIQY